MAGTPPLDDRQAAQPAGHRRPDHRERAARYSSRRAGTDRGSVARARLENGPLKGQTIEVDLVEARPPKTIEVSAEPGSTTYRYCLSRWTEKGEAAVYTFLYPV